MDRNRLRSGSPAIVDVTDRGSRPALAMITRFPPSVAGGAREADELATRLRARHGVPVEVIRLVSPGDSPAGHPVVMHLDPRWHLAGSQAARRGNRRDMSVIRLDRHVPFEMVDACLDALETPVVLMSDDVGGNTRRLAALAGRVSATVVPSETSARRLLDATGGEARVEVIPHGSPWRAVAPHSRARKTILAWGFLEPGAGAERVVRALARLTDLDPQPVFRLIGVADPSWPPQEAGRYRELLMKEAERRGVSHRVQMVSMHQPDDELEREIAACDVIAVTYDSSKRTASRILTEAVSTGRPVVATAFPAAIELLATGAGMTVDHGDDDDLAGALRGYLTDDTSYRRAARVASALSPGLHADEAARRVALLLTELSEHVPRRVRTGV